MDATILHDLPIDDIHAFQRPKDLARQLGIAERTLRTYIGKGRAERIRGPNGRIYYRISETALAAESPAAAVEASGMALAEMVETVIALKDSHIKDMMALHDRISSAECRAIEYRTLAEVASRDYERVTREASDLRRLLAEAAITQELSETSWWEFARRRTLQARLNTPLLETR